MGLILLIIKHFINELPSDEEKKHKPGEMVFALLNPINKKPSISHQYRSHTINTKHLISISNEISNILRHEFIHSKQDSKGLSNTHYQTK
jgi:hypothetical protein